MRVVVAEDSRTIRELLVELLHRDPAFQIVGEATNGVEAVELALRLKPDLIAMDIHMPLMDGLEATREIMSLAPTPIVLVTSSVSRMDASLSFEALRAGALTVASKPDDPGSPWFDARSEDLLRTLKAMAQVKVVRRWADRRVAPPHPLALKPSTAPRIVALAASTGGPAALQHILSPLPPRFGVPILVVQHIASGFVAALANWLDGSSLMHVKVAEHGEALTAGTAYLAPDDRHLGVTADGRAGLSDAPPVGGHRPSANHLFASAVTSFGPAVLAVILTGMGRDGVDGLAAVRAAGGYVLAQDEASSIVYGMPREAAAAGLTNEIVPLGGMSARMMSLVAPGAV